MPEYVARIAPIAVLTMLRRGEVLGLRDADIDLEAGSIAVFTQRQDGARVATKTRAGRRSVDVGPRVVRLIREQQLAREPNAGGYLFPTRVGAPFDADNFMHRVFKPAARAAGIPELTFHDLRHTDASLMIAAGCHVKVIAEQMGHSDGGGLVLKRYGHLYKGPACRRRRSSRPTSSAQRPIALWDGRGMNARWGSISMPDRTRKAPDLRGLSGERMMGLEPTTFCMASRRSSQLSYIREVAGVYRPAHGCSIG